MEFDPELFLECGAIVALDRETLLLGFGSREDAPFFKQTADNASFYFPDFFLKIKNSRFKYAYEKVIKISELQRMLTFAQPQTITKINWQKSDKKDFIQSFNHLKNLFETNTLKKAVPYIKETAAITVSKGQLVKSLMNVLEYVVKYPAFVYGCWNSQGGVLGATPEILFHMKASTQLDTMACAGTRKRGPNEFQLLNDPKERYEHQLVVDGIVESLKPFGELELGSVELKPFSQLVHLITPIKLKIKRDISFENAVKALHPTPALGAFPRENGFQWLTEYNHLIPRGYYGAPAGFAYKNMSTCFVGIRNMQWDANGMYLFAGCGVVPDSQCDREWDEIQLKLQSIKELLGL